MKRLIAIFIVLISQSCNSDSELQRIDVQVDLQITKEFNTIESNLWNELEKEFYSRLNHLGLFDDEKDSLEAIVDLMKTIRARGFPNEYYVDFENEETQKLIQNLNEIGITENGKDLQKFLHRIINPILKDSDFNSSIEDSPKDFIVKYGLLDPDSISISFVWKASSMHKYYDEDDLSRPGLYKAMMLFFLYPHDR